MEAQQIAIKVAFQMNHRGIEESLMIKSGSTLLDGLQQFPWPSDYEPGQQLSSGEIPEGFRITVWGVKVKLDHQLSDAERVEISNPLIANPKLNRVRKAAAQQPHKQTN